MEWTTEHGHRFDFAIVGEPSAKEVLGDSIKIGRRGSLNGQVTVTGTQGHVAYPDKANNPLPAMAQLVLALSGKLDDGNAQFPPSNLEFTSIDVGNATTNVIPAKATARFNVRFNDQWTPLSLAMEIGAKCAEVGDETGCAIAFEAGKSAHSFLSPLGEPVQLVRQVIREQTGIETELSTSGGTSDARFIAQYCPVVELGLPGQTMHKVDENVAVNDVEGLATLYAAFIARYLAG
jgi:succinyl-diaminopimelate desuccinylase